MPSQKLVYVLCKLFIYFGYINNNHLVTCSIAKPVSCLRLRGGFSLFNTPVYFVPSQKLVYVLCKLFIYFGYSVVGLLLAETELVEICFRGSTYASHN